MVKKIFKYIGLFLLGFALAVSYSFITKTSIDIETVVMFFLLYLYMLFFVKFLIRLFK